MSTAVEQLLGMLDLQDPFCAAPAELLPLQLEAAQDRLEARRSQIPVLGERARAVGIDRIGSPEDLIPLLFRHDIYKSYPESFLIKQQWDLLCQWLDSLSTQRVSGIDLQGVSDIDDWLLRLRSADHYVQVSSGTTGKCSIMNGAPEDHARFSRQVARIAEARSPAGADDRARTTVVPAGPRPTTPKEMFAAVEAGLVAAWGRPDAVLYLSEEPLRIADLNRAGHLRRAMAAGTATAQEIADVDARARAREAKMDEDLSALARAIVQLRDDHQRIVLFGYMPLIWRLKAALEGEGVKEGAFDDVELVQGGGTKGTALPPDYVDQLAHFFNVKPGGVQRMYAMSESPSIFPGCNAGRYHFPPWVLPLLLDRDGGALLNRPSGQVEGRMAFFDIMASGRWGGNITGDKVTVDFSPCECGRPSPTVLDDIVRYADLPEGDDKLTCAGSAEAYASGYIPQGV